MNTSLCWWISLLFAARATAAVGPFSGVSADNINATPSLVRERVFTAQGQALPALGAGMAAGTVNGETAVVTQDGFVLEFQSTLAAGRYQLSVQGRAPNRGADSLWVEVDGNPDKQNLAVATGEFGEHSVPVTLTSPGPHRFRLTLREKAGSVLQGVSLHRVGVKVSVPALRAELAGKHPRLFLTREDIPKLRARMNDPRVRQFYTPAGVLTKKPPAYKPGQRNGGPFRPLGNYALSQLLAPQPEKLKSILRWLEAATAYPHCGVDLDAEYFMEGVTLAYDWLYDEIPAELRTRVRDTIARQAREVYTASLAGRTGGGHSYQQNHYWFAHLALALGAAAVHGEVAEAEQWLPWAWDRFERIALTFSPDGSFHEGPGYWNFSMPTLYRYCDLYEQCTGRPLPAGDDGLRGQAEFRFHYLYPGLNLTAALEDIAITAGRPPLDVILWEARRFQDPFTMSLAERLRRAPASDASNLLWLDETLPGVDRAPPVPLAKYYRDVETAFARTAWDDQATFVAMVSRPLGGHRWAELCERFQLGGTGHNHPEQNHFVLFGRGEVLVADPGYTYEKQTRNHNTVLVGGQGQYGDGEMWPAPTPGRAHFTGFVTQGDVTIMAGDAVSAYPKKLGLTRFDRTLVLAGRDLVVIHDRLAAREPQVFSWLLHHYGQSSREGDQWTIVRRQAQLGVGPIAAVPLQAVEHTYRPRYTHPTRNLTPQDAEISVLELKTPPVQETSFLVPLLIGEAGATLPAVQNISNTTCEAVRQGSLVVAFNRGRQSMNVATPSGGILKSAAACLVVRQRDGKQEVIQLPFGP